MVVRRCAMGAGEVVMSATTTASVRDNRAQSLLVLAGLPAPELQVTIPGAAGAAPSA